MIKFETPVKSFYHISLIQLKTLQRLLNVKKIMVSLPIKLYRIWYDLSLEFLLRFTSHQNFPCSLLPCITACSSKKSPCYFKVVIFYHVYLDCITSNKAIKISIYCWIFRGLPLPSCSGFFCILCFIPCYIRSV